MKDRKQSFALTFGSIGGVATIVFMLLVYIIDHTLVTSFPILLVEVLITVIFMVIAVWYERKENGGYITFRPALKTTYGTAVLAWLVFCVFYFSLYKFVDPELINVFYKRAAENLVMHGKELGKSDQEIANEIARQKGSGLRFDDPKTMFFLYLFLVILSFFYAMIVSAIATAASRDNHPNNRIAQQTEENN